LGKAPEPRGGEAARKDDQQELPERLLRERLKRALSACRLAAAREPELDREDPHPGKRCALGDEADPRERVQPVGVLHLVSGSIEACGSSHGSFISTDPASKPWPTKNLSCASTGPRGRRHA